MNDVTFCSFYVHLHFKFVVILHPIKSHLDGVLLICSIQDNCRLNISLERNFKRIRKNKFKTKLMNKQFLIIILLISASAVFAQRPMSKGQTQLNVGVGLSSWGIPVYLGFDHGISPDITLGAELSYRGYNNRWDWDDDDDDYNRNYHHSIIGFLGNANYHFNNVLNIPSPWDFYAGLNVGFYSWNSPKGYKGSHTSGLGLGGQVGARYFFNNKVGLNLEFGGGNAFSGGKLGLTFKL